MPHRRRNLQRRCNDCKVGDLKNGDLEARSHLGPCFQRCLKIGTLPNYTKIRTRHWLGYFQTLDAPALFRFFPGSTLQLDIVAQHFLHIFTLCSHPNLLTLWQSLFNLMLISIFRLTKSRQVQPRLALSLGVSCRN